MSDSVKPTILLFLIIISAGVIGGFLAADRGRKVAGWCLLCALFPPSLLFLYFARPLREVEGIFRKCPRCGAIIRWRASECKFCRSETAGGKHDGW